MTISAKFYQWVAAMYTTIAWMAIALWAPYSPLKVAVSALFLLTVPGFLFYRLIRRDEKLPAFWEMLGYAVGLSVLFLMLTGLAVNLVLPWFGDSRPLSAVPLALAVGLGTLGLVGANALLRRPLVLRLKRAQLNFGEAWFSLAGLATVALSILGALSLNNGGTDAFSILMLTLVCVMGVILPFGGRWLRRNASGFAIYTMGLAMLLATSLRGWFITGHDIVQEYEVFQLTSVHARWSMNFLHDPYNACLSITILPTMLARLTGLSDPYVFKILIQCVFALVPVLVYLLASKFVSRAAAAVVAFIYITFPTFMMDFPMLNRQEVAFLFFGLAFLALFDAKMDRKLRLALVPTLFLGMVLSHYSTSYVAIGALLVYKVLELITKRTMTALGKTAPAMLRLGWATILTVTAMLYIWEVPITHTAGQAESTIASIASTLTGFGHQTSGPNLSGPQLYNAYLNNVPKTRDLPVSDYYSSAITAQYVPAQMQPTSAPLTAFGAWLNKHISVYNLLAKAKQLYGLAIEGLIVMGLALVSWIKGWRIKPAYALLGVSFFILIVAQVLMPSAINYGLLRLMQQGMLFLAVPMLVVTYAALGWVKVPDRLRLGAVALVFAVGFAFTSGLMSALTGGFPQQLVTANSGFYYEAYYTHADELAGFAWLDNNAPKGAVVDSDEFARRKMITYADIYSRTATAPAAIAKNGYVYLSYGDVTTGRMPTYYNGVLIYQAIPYDFLNATKNAVYTNGNVRIYR